MSEKPSKKKKKWRRKDCQACGLWETAQSVCLMGQGPKPARAMVVGEAPGKREDDINRPFSGRAGELLDRALDIAGLNREELYITNVVHCRPPDNRTPDKDETRTCRDLHLIREINRVKPEFILALGNTAYKALLNPRGGIMKNRGVELPSEEYGCTILPTVHPALILRDPRHADDFMRDIVRFAKLLNGDIDTDELENLEVRIVRDIDEAIEWCDYFEHDDHRGQAIAYDVETTGLDPYDPEARILSIGLACMDSIVVFPLETKRGLAPEIYPRLNLLLGGGKLKPVAHNAKFDDKWLLTRGVYCRPVFDTMLAAHLIDENRRVGLKQLARRLCDAPNWDVGIDFKKGTPKLSKLLPYNGYDAYYTLRLYAILRTEMIQDKALARVFQQLLMPACRAFRYIENRGVWVDPDKLTAARASVEGHIAMVEERLGEFGEDVNWNSPQQVARILFDELELPLSAFTKSGAPSTSEAVLIALKDEHEIIEDILEFRKWRKYRTTYVEPWSEQVDGNSRLHPRFKLHGTVTGRLSAEKPNLQQVPRDPFIRGLIGAPSNWSFVQADFSQIELRVAAALAQEPTMIEAFHNEEDLHTLTAMTITGKPAKKITKHERKKAKAVNFGFLYGMGARKYVEYAKTSYGLDVTLPEAEAIRQRFFDLYPRLLDWHEEQRELVRQDGQIRTLFGRVRHLPDIFSHDFSKQSAAERQAINTPVQSVASDLTLLALLQLNRIQRPRADWIALDGHEFRIVGSVHDAILCEVMTVAVDWWREAIRETMENLPTQEIFGFELGVPVKVDIDVSQHWGLED